MCKFFNRMFVGLYVVSAPFVFADVIDGEDLVDPTRPFFLDLTANQSQSEVQDFFRSVVPVNFGVTFVRASSTSPIAVINDQQVTIGDVIGGATVVAIDRHGVTLLVNDEEKRINLYSTSIKAPVIER